MTAGWSAGSVVDQFISNAAHAAVVQLQIPGSEKDVFSGFFISPAGHLITAWHSVKPETLVLPCRFELIVRYVERDGITVTPPQTVIARSDRGWVDREADWALLRLDIEPRGYLPVSQVARLRRADRLGASLRAFGFTSTAEAATLGAFAGEYSRTLTDKRRFRVAYSVRSQGQSGGPVFDLGSRTVIGVARGFIPDEMLTGEVGELDRAHLSSLLASEADLDAVVHEWHARAADHIQHEHPAFADLSDETFLPELPSEHLQGRPVVEDAVDAIIDRSQAAFYFHGGPGSGKTTICREIVERIRAEGAADAVFWHDFELEDQRGLDHLVRKLAVHLLRSQGDYQPLFACLEADFASDKREALDHVIAALARSRSVYVFDNLQRALDGDAAEDVRRLIGACYRAAIQSQATTLVCSWHRPPIELQHIEVVPVEGFSKPEVSAFLDRYELAVSDDLLATLTGFATDIKSVEAFVRDPGWRASLESGRPGREPQSLREHWRRRYHDPAKDSSRRVLLALTLFERPVGYDTLEAAADVPSFASVLDELRSDPPLVNCADDTFYVHSTVAAAMRSAADQREVTAGHRRIGDRFLVEGLYAYAARHYVSAGELDQALAVVFGHRDDDIVAGRLEEVEAVAEAVRRSEVGAAHPYELHAVVASCAQIRGKFVEAARHWQLAQRGVSPDSAEAAHAYNRLADCLRLASDYDAALASYSAARELSNGSLEVDKVRQFAIANLGLGKLERLKADYPSALTYYADASEAFEFLFDDGGLIEAQFGMGEVHRLQSEWARSAEEYGASLDLAVRRGNLEREAYARWGVAEVHRLTGAFDLAEQQHTRGLSLCVQVGDTRSEGWALLGLAETARAQGRLAQSSLLYQDAMERFVATGSVTEQAHTHLGLAELARDEGSFEPALYVRAREVYEAKGMRHCLVQCDLREALALARTGSDPARADRLRASAAACLDGAGFRLDPFLASAIDDPHGAAEDRGLNFP